MGLMKKLTSAVVVASLVFSLVGTAFADWSAAGVATAASRMKALGIVKGTVLADGSVDMALNANITRAQLVTIIVRAFGQGDNAALLKGAPAFTDTASHWASGEIAIAKNIIEKNGFSLGTTATTFSPNKDVSSAEAIAFVMKFLGAKAAAGQTWPMDYIQGALDAGIISADDKAALAAFPNSAANRGLVFYLADKAFASYKLANGKTMYTTYVDTTAPVVSVDSYKASTDADSVTLTGKVSGASALYVGSATNAVTPDIDGNWKATVPLTVGENKVFIQATDIAGNVGTPASGVVITRVAGAAATVKATLAATTLAAGATSVLTVAVSDKAGNEISNATFDVTADAAIGTFDKATMTLTAAKKPATGNLTITSGTATTTVAVTVTAGALAKVTADVASVAPGGKATLTAQDANGNTVSGVTYTVDSADALVGSNGVFIASKAGTYTVTAKAGDATATVKIGVYGAASKVVLDAQKQVVGNSDSGSSTTGSLYTLTATLVDANGNALTNDTTSTMTLTSPTGFTLDSTTAATQTVKNGVVTWQVKADKSAVGTIGTFNVNSSAITTATPHGTANVEVIAQVATALKIDNFSSQIVRANSASSVTADAYIVDQNGKLYLGAGQTVNFAVTGPGTISTSALTAKTSGSQIYAGAKIAVTFNSLTGQTGAIGLTASVDGLTPASGTVTAAVASDAKVIKVTSDKTTATANSVDTVTLKVQVTDGQGVPVAVTKSLKISTNTDTATLAQFTVTGATLNTTTNVYEFSTGTDGSATVTVKAANYTGNLVLSFADPASTLSGQDVTVAFGADAVSTFAVSRANVNVAAAAPNATLTVQLYDAAGNKAAKSGVTVTFTGPSNDVTLNGSAKTVDVKTDANGVATVNATVLGYVSTSYVITATSTGLTVKSGASGTTTIAVVNTVATTFSDLYVRNAADNATLVTTKANTPVLIKGVLKDANGKAIASESVKLTVASTSAHTVTGSGSTAAATTTDIDATAGISATTDSTGAFSFLAAPYKAGTFTFTLTDSAAATSVTSTVNVGVSAAAATKFIVAEADSSSIVKVTAGTLAGPFTLKLVDAYGNAVTTTSNLDVTVGVTSGTTGIRTSATSADVTTVTIAAGTSQVSFYQLTAGSGNYVVTFSSGTLTSYALNVNH